ncbi:LruC domain-containing protein [Bacteroides sp.]
MKRKSIFTLSLLLSVLAFTSCEKNLYDESKQPQNDKTVADLVVPDGFDWKMTKNAQCTIIAKNKSAVSIYSDKECDESSMLATLQTSNETITIPLSLPAISKEAYLQYETTEGKKVVMAGVADESNTIHFALPENSKPVAQTRAEETRSGGSINYPNNGWGTIMFEDMFPSLGDYDFNDFVLAYRAQVPFYSDGNKTLIDAIQLGIQLRAIGGTLPYSPFLRLKKLPASSVEEIEVYQHFNTSVTEIEWSAGPNGEVIIDFSNLASAISKPSGSRYFNTEKEYTTTDIPELSIVIYMQEEVETQSVDFESFDFYLAKANQGTEIHLGGYEPVYDTYFSTHPNLGDDYYYSNKGLIWGLSVPAPIAHVIEKGNFLDAYTDFATWATSGGNDKADWYKGNKNSELLIKDN